MDAWIVALRGDEDALVESRATLGPPVAWVGSLEIFAFETADPATAARSIARITENITGIAGAVALDTGPGESARERALALALAAAPGEVLFDRPTRQKLDREFVFVKGSARAGWTLPFPAAALAPIAARRADCRDALAHVRSTPRLIAREREIAALGIALLSERVAVLRAAEGMGGGRVIAEAAARAGKTIARLPQSALADADGLWRAVASLPETDWLVVDPVPAAAAPLMPRLAAKLPQARRLVLRAAPGVNLEMEEAEREITLGPLREYDARGLVRALLGETDERIVRRLALRAGGAPRLLVETVRAAVQLGEIVRSPEGRWIARERRALRPRGAPSNDPIAARVADLPPLPGRALRVVGAVGDGAREVEVLAALRGTLTPEPAEALAPLVALGLVEIADERVALAASLRTRLAADDPRVLDLALSGALEFAAQGEAAIRAGRKREAALAFAAAARAALARRLRAAAARFAAAAHAQQPETPEVVEALRAVAQVLAPAVVLVSALPAKDSPRPRARSYDPAALEQAAADRAARNDLEAAARMHALAEILRGNAQRALVLADNGRAEGSGKALLLAALAQAASGHVHRAVRTALSALAFARRAGERSGEVAALSLLSTLYRAVGREDDARNLAESARRVASSVPSQASA